MSHAVAFLEHVLRTGEAVMHQRPIFADGDRPEALRVLQAIHTERRLEIAGPVLQFDAPSALAGAEFLAAACWHSVGDDEAPEAVAKSLHFARSPDSPESHLSGDLCLRFLATVYRRVRTRPTDDVLHKAVVDVLRHWPLSGAGSDVPDPPVGDVTFSGHFGLQLLYAERLASALRPAWVPSMGRTREAVELVLQQQGKSLPQVVERGGE